MCHINEINEKRVQNDGVLLPFQTSLPPGATLTRTRIAICAAISLQYICVSSGLRQEHEKWRRAQSSVPQIGVVYLTVNSFCVCVCVCLCFYLFSSPLERWHDKSSHRSTNSRELTPRTFLLSPPHLMTWALSHLHLLGQLVFPLCLRIKRCCWTQHRKTNWELSDIQVAPMFSSVNRLDFRVQQLFRI